MLDISYIRNHQKIVEEAARNKGYSVDVATVIKLDDQRRELGQKIDSLRRERNSIAAQMKNGKPNPEL